MGGEKFIRFMGNCPSNVSKDAKYTVRLEDGEYVVGLYFRSPDGELWYPTSGEHSELVEMVNEIKTHFNGSPGGAFYINEYRQVIVPAGDEGHYYFAGEYEQQLTFEFEGKIISGDAKDLDGNALEPGDLWEGPHAGIPYILKAGGKDIYYRYWVRPNVEREVHLSDVIGRKKAEAFAKNIAKIKGFEGGRFYVNEFRHIFIPKEGDYGMEYRYVGRIEDMNEWFPKPVFDSSKDEIAAGKDESEKK